LTARSTLPRTLAGISSSIAEFMALYSPPCIPTNRIRHAREKKPLMVAGG
jgi:hypothetical protein